MRGDPKKPQISVRGDTFQKLRDYADAHNTDVASVVDDLVTRALGYETVILDVEPEPPKTVVDVTPANMQGSSTPLTPALQRFAANCTCDLRHRRWNGNGVCLTCGLKYIYRAATP